MTGHKWVVSTLVVVVICAVITLMVFHNDIGIAYHHRAMMRAWAKIREVGPRGDQMPWIDSYEHHRDKLVQCGHFIRREFPLTTQPPETNRVWKQLQAEFPEHIHATMQTTQWGHSENMIIVWDRPDRIPAWEAVIRRFDVPKTPTSTEANVLDGD